MRSALIAAAFVAGAIAVPHYKRDVVTDTDIEIVYATEIITVTAAAPSSTDVAPVEDDTASSLSFRHHRYGHSTTVIASTVKTTTTSKAATVAPVSTVRTTSTSVAAAPVSTTKATTTSTKPTTTSVVAAPTSTKPTTTSVVAAPTSTKASTTPVVSTTPVASTTSTPVSKVATSVAAASTTAAASAKPSTYAQIAVYHHNIHRANHSAADVVWDAGVASTAAQIASSCVYAHNVTAGGGGYGQNIAAGVKSDNISAIITDLFYNGEVGWFNALYGIAQPDMTNFEHWGHFSQIVWKDTTKIGCATQDCSASGLANVGSNVAPFFTVCNYVNPGNYANEYGANIGSPLNYPTAEWNAGL